MRLSDDSLFNVDDIFGSSHVMGDSFSSGLNATVTTLAYRHTPRREQDRWSYGPVPKHSFSTRFRGSSSISVLFSSGGRRVPRQNAGLQEFESRSSVHLALHGFKTVDVTLHRPVVPAAGDGQRDSLLVPL